MEKFGEKVKRFRLKGGLTQKQLAEMVGISQSYLSDIETGRVFPGQKIYFNLDEFCMVSDILSSEDETVYSNAPDFMKNCVGTESIWEHLGDFMNSFRSSHASTLLLVHLLILVAFENSKDEMLGVAAFFSLIIFSWSLIVFLIKELRR